MRRRRIDVGLATETSRSVPGTAGTVITTADLQAGLKLYNVTLREGDAVFINTGWGDLFQQYPAQNATYNGGEPGIRRRRRNGSRRRR